MVDDTQDGAESAVSVTDDADIPTPKGTPVADQKEGFVYVPLTKNIQHEGKEIEELVFPEPSGKHLVRMTESPVTLDFSTGTAVPKINPKVMMQFMTILGGYPPSTLQQLNGPDLNRAFLELAGFLLPSV